MNALDMILKQDLYKQSVSGLNESFLTMMDSLKDQPQGTKNSKQNRKGLSGVQGSEQAAIEDYSALKAHDLKENLEVVGLRHNIAPALLAGLGSRESHLGRILRPYKSLYWGWGDYRRRGNDKKPTYNGFGILQLDRLTAPFADVRTKLNNTLREIRDMENNPKTTKFTKDSLPNPCSVEWLEWGAKTLLEKLRIVERKFPNLGTGEQLATAVSFYNGGRGLPYPENDKYTTGHDYANDTLIRARWFAQNWDTIEVFVKKTTEFCADPRSPFKLLDNEIRGGFLRTYEDRMCPLSRNRLEDQLQFCPKNSKENMHSWYLSSYETHICRLSKIRSDDQPQICRVNSNDRSDV